MKKMLPGLLTLILGFGASRLFNASPWEEWEEDGSHPPISKQLAGPALKPPRSVSLEGDWKPAAETWAEEDPAGFYKWLVARGIPPGGDVLRILFRSWVRQDADAAFEAVFNLPGDFQRQEEVLDQMMGWALAQPGGLGAVLKWMPQVEKQLRSWSSPGEEWMRTGPPQDIARILAQHASGNGYSGTLLSQFAAYWGSQDMPAAMDWMRTLRPEIRADVFTGIMRIKAEKDPAAALVYLATEATSEERFHAYEALGKLAKTDPKAALDWWERNLGVADYNSLRQIFGQWCRQNALEARDYALSIEDPTLRRDSLISWADTAPAGDLLEAIAQESGTQNRKSLMDAMAVKIPRDEADAEKIREFVEQGIQHGVTPVYAAAVSRSFATYRDAGAALEWVTHLPEAYQEESVGAVLSVWKDKVAAAQAVEKLPEGPMKAAARQHLIPRAYDPFR